MRRYVSIVRLNGAVIAGATLHPLPRPLTYRVGEWIKRNALAPFRCRRTQGARSAKAAKGAVSAAPLPTRPAGSRSDLFLSVAQS